MEFLFCTAPEETTSGKLQHNTAWHRAMHRLNFVKMHFVSIKQGMNKYSLMQCQGIVCLSWKHGQETGKYKLSDIGNVLKNQVKVYVRGIKLGHQVTG